MSFVCFECNGKAIVGGREIEGKFKVLLTRIIGISFGDREGVSLYLLDKGVSELLGEGKSELKFDEGNLGIYHHTKDIREGPYVNHKFHSVKLSKTKSAFGCSLRLLCKADYSNSTFDSYWYKGSTTGTFTAQMELVIPEQELEPMANHMHNQAKRTP